MLSVLSMSVASPAALFLFTHHHRGRYCSVAKEFDRVAVASATIYPAHAVAAKCVGATDALVIALCLGVEDGVEVSTAITPKARVLKSVLSNGCSREECVRVNMVSTRTDISPVLCRDQVNGATLGAR